MPPGPSVQNPYLLAIVAASVLVAFGFLMMLVKRYKRCPSNRILVIYGKTTEGRSARCLHGGGAFGQTGVSLSHARPTRRKILLNECPFSESRVVLAR